MKWNKIYSKHLKVVVRGNVNVGHTFESPPSLSNYMASSAGNAASRLFYSRGYREGVKERILYGQLDPKGRGGKTRI